uniref:Scm like with four mbt domains 1 n=1 Tax=Oncorhynchus kisutch TaxID=8019 RepID=A0A8C7D189_ONCKI
MSLCLSAGGSDLESDFNWDEYLEENGVLAVPHHAFKHVDRSLQTGLAPGMMLEVSVRSEPDQPYWVATIITACGQLLLLRYEGYHDDRRADFWSDIMTSDLHPLGWGRQQGRPMRPPNGDGYSTWTYLDPLLYPPGWAEENSCSLTPPAVLCGLRSEAEWEEVRKTIRQPKEEAFNRDFFKDRPVLSPHCFSEGMKLEAVNPAAPFNISPATVTKVLNEQYFLVQMDSLQGDSEGAGPGSSFLCHHGSTEIFPVQWSLKNGVPLSPPPGYQGQDFDWAYYLKQCGAEGAPESCFPQSDHDFVEFMRLEAVNPISPKYIHMATVTRVRGQHIWIGLEGLKQTLPDVITHVESLDIFPVSWCESNGYPLQHPSKATGQAPNKTLLSNLGIGLCQSAQGNGKYSCPKIFFNHLCFSGPYLNKGRIADLPQSIGPGNCVLVLKEVLTLLISSAYKPSRVLRELQQDPELRRHGQGETLKAKYKGKSYRATVGISRTADQVAEFCRKTCVRLECCPNLITPHMVLEHCSENCSLLTKTKYTHYYGKKKTKRIGRPPGGHTNLDISTKEGSRRKKRKPLSVCKKRLFTSVDSTPAWSPLGSGEEEEEDLDEDYSLSEEDSGSEQQGDSEVLERKSQPASPRPTPPEPRPREGPQLTSYSDDDNQPPSPMEIDGQALLLLSLPTVQECMGLKLGPAIKLCHLIERIKLAFYQHFARR